MPPKPTSVPADASLTVSGLPVLHLLVVDGDAEVNRACCEIAESMGFATRGILTTTEAQSAIYRQPVDIVLLDLRLRDGGLALLEEIRRTHPSISVVVMTAFATVHSAVEAMRLGATDYLTKPFALEELATTLERAAQRHHFNSESRRLRERLRTQAGMGALVGRSPEMMRLYRILSKVAFSNHPVLILGEIGTGKEMVARAIHNYGNHAAQPFVSVDCGAMVPNLMESELFGHVKGAFAGANQRKEGLLTAAEGGTVFLDEIGALPLDLQAKLLRALQEREVRPLGATQPLPLKARILAATNRDLVAMVEQGRFRKDLYFRLNVVNLRIPSLRQRKEDIPLLASHFLERMRREHDVPYTFSDDSMRVMSEYDWPGNVRELENAIERACTLSSGPVLNLADMPTQLQEFRSQTSRELVTFNESSAEAAAPPPQQNARAGNKGSHRIISIAELEKNAILDTIRQLNGDKLMAARLLGIGKTTLYRKLKEYGIDDSTHH